MDDATQARFWAKVDRSAGPDECWPWLASHFPNGYGQFGHQGAHRVAYLLEHGELPPAPMVIDHLCGQRGCVNPTHLEAATQSQNVVRGYLIPVMVALRREEARNRTHCRKRGHEMTPENTYVTPTGCWRVCKQCKRERKRHAIEGISVSNS